MRRTSKIKRGMIPVLMMALGSLAFPSAGISEGRHKDKTGIGHEHKQGVSLEARKIKNVLTAYAEAVSSRDIEKMGAFLTGSSFSVVEGKHANWGWRDYRDNHLKPEFSSERFKLLDYVIRNIRVGEGHMLSYAVYDYELTYELDGEKKIKKGMGTAILESRKNGWMIRHIHSS